MNFNILKLPIFLIFLCNFSEIFSKEESSVANEYCQMEMFNPICSNSDLIRIESAKLGRMKIGNCIDEEELRTFEVYKNDPKYFECYTDVTNLLNGICFSKSTCEIRILEIMSRSTKNCAHGLTLYLEANFSCLTGAVTNNDCKVFLTSDAKHLLLNSLNSSNKCGTESKPFILQAPKGQLVKVQIIPIMKNINTTDRKCKTTLGVVKDEQLKKTYSICNTMFRTNAEILSVINSANNQLKIYLNTITIREFQFSLLRFEAVGCSDMIPPEDAWLKRVEDNIVIGCYSSQQTWKFICKNNQWIGVMGNCSSNRNTIYTGVVMDRNLNEINERDMDIPFNQQILIMVSIASFGIVICLIIIFTGAICLKRMNKKDGSQSIQIYCNQGTTFNPVSENHSSFANNFKTKKNQINKTESKILNGQNLNNGLVTNIERENAEDKYFILDSEE